MILTYSIFCFSVCIIFYTGLLLISVAARLSRIENVLSSNSSFCILYIAHCKNLFLIERLNFKTKARS